MRALAVGLGTEVGLPLLRPAANHGTIREGTSGVMWAESTLRRLIAEGVDVRTEITSWAQVPPVSSPRGQFGR